MNINQSQYRDQALKNTNAIEAVSLNIRNFSVAFLNISKKEMPVNSGVLVHLGEHLFIATAAHCIPNHPDKKLAFITTEIGPIETQKLSIRQYGKIESKWPDVGFLELDNTNALRILGKQAISLDRIRIAGLGDPSRLCYLYGYPAALLKIKQDKTALYYNFTPMCYTHVPIQSDNWPGVSLNDPKIDKMVDIFLPYDHDEELWKFKNDAAENKLVDVEGSSGGGFWQGYSKSNQIWSAETIHLIGIQSRWSKKKKYIRGCQIIHWLSLIYMQYDGLRPILLSSFPDLEKDIAGSPGS